MPYNEDIGDLPGSKLLRTFKTNQPATFDNTVAINGALTLTGVTNGVKKQVIDSNAATLTLTAAQTGAVVLLDRAAGTTVTLPAPAVGLNFLFVAPVSVTSNAYKIITDAGTTFLLGQVDVAIESTGAAKLFPADGSTIVSLNGNGSTTGGLLGSQVQFTCISSTLWNVEGTWNGSGTVATPFATS